MSVVVTSSIKWRLGIGFLIAGQTLHAIGFRGEADASPELVIGLRVTYAAIPMLLAIGALTALAYFPISKKTYQTLVGSHDRHVSVCAAVASGSNER